MMKTWGAAFVVVASLTLGGCSASPAASPASSSPASASAAASQPAAAASSAAPSAAPASGTTISGTGYRYTVPKGWAKPEGVDAPTGTDSVAADLEDQDGFSDNVNVVVLNTGSVTPKDAEEQGPAGLKQVGATKVTVADRITVAGEESAHLSAVLVSSGKKYRVEQVYLTHDAKTYVITFSFSPGVSAADRSDVLTPVLASWQWA